VPPVNGKTVNDEDRCDRCAHRVANRSGDGCVGDQTLASGDTRGSGDNDTQLLGPGRTDADGGCLGYAGHRLGFEFDRYRRQGAAGHMDEVVNTSLNP
jgi:hypothetical protein